MIFVTNSQGTVVSTVPEQVYQGSNKANGIYLVAPFSHASSVVATYTLPNGTTGNSIIMNQSAIDDERLADYSVWSCDMTSAMTQLYGKLLLQFKVFSGSQIIATSSAYITVNKGVTPNDIYTPEPSVYNQILTALSAINQKLDNTVGTSIYYTTKELKTTETSILLSDIVLPYGKTLQVGDFVLSHSLLFLIEQIDGNNVTITLYTNLAGADGVPSYEYDDGTAPETLVERTPKGKYKVDDVVYVIFAKSNSRLQKIGLYHVTQPSADVFKLAPLGFADGSQGVKGEKGTGIQNIQKTGTTGLVDTYTITLTDNTTFTITVTNGRGIKTIIKTSTAGLVDTYTITYSDNTTSTFTVTNGKDGKSIDSIISVVVTPATVSVDNNGIHLNGSVKATDDKGEETVTAISQDIPIVGSEHITVDKDGTSEKVVVKFDQTVLDEIDTHEQEISEIQAKISPQASSTNQLADKNFVNSSINNIAAFYITKDANGTAFSTYAELAATTTFYSGGEVRVPSRNDYCIVREDETHLINGKPSTTRYIYQNGWEFQYVVNETALTEAQLAAINSGITAALVGQIGTNKDDITGIKTNYAQKTGTYSGMTVGKATSADKATQDGDGKNIASTYAKQTGTYSNITAGKATNADIATKAKQDNDGNDIPTTYAKKTDVVLKAVQGSKTTEMTEEVGIDANGKLWVKAGGGGGGFDEDAKIYNKQP